MIAFNDNINDNIVNQYNHMIVEVRIPLAGRNNYGKKTHKLTDWEAFRRALPETHDDIQDIEEWTTAIMKTVDDATQEIETDEGIDKMDSRLAHLLEAKSSLKARCLKQRTNRRLRKRIAELNKQIEKHCRVLCAQQWNQACNEADGMMHTGKTWNMLRHLLDETTTKSTQHNNLARTLHRAIMELGEDEVKKALDAKYLPTTPTEDHPGYLGEENAELDKVIEPWEVRDALQNLNRRSAAGPDRVTNKALSNLNDAAVEALTRYFNKCWSAGRFPKQRKTAKTNIIPKPGMPPSIKNLRTDLAHVVRGERAGARPHEAVATLPGRRRPLAQLPHRIQK